MKFISRGKFVIIYLHVNFVNTHCRNGAYYVTMLTVGEDRLCVYRVLFSF